MNPSWKDVRMWIKVGYKALVVVLALLPSQTLAQQQRPTKFCGCPEHQHPQQTSSYVSARSTYGLHAYDDAFETTTGRWCYTRSVWIDLASTTTGRFEWRADNTSEVMSGAIKADEDPCGSYYNNYDTITAATAQPSVIVHGPELQSRSDILLFFAQGEEFRDSFARRLLERTASLVGFPRSSYDGRMGVRVASKVTPVSGRFDIEYTITSLFNTTLNLLLPGRGPASGRQYPTLFWEAALSSEFSSQLEKAGKGILDGNASVTIKLTNVPYVQASVGRLMILLPGAPLPNMPGAQPSHVLLAGLGSGFRVAPVPPPPRNLGVR